MIVLHLKRKVCYLVQQAHLVTKYIEATTFCKGFSLFLPLINAVDKLLTHNIDKKGGKGGIKRALEFWEKTLINCVLWSCLRIFVSSCLSPKKLLKRETWSLVKSPKNNVCLRFYKYKRGTLTFQSTKIWKYKRKQNMKITLHKQSSFCIYIHIHSKSYKLPGTNCCSFIYELYRVSNCSKKI